MKIIKTIKRMTRVISFLKRHNKTIGFVPTMGYFHEGHLSLMKKAKKECDVVITSIFVNPTQFGPKEDFKKYPRNLKRDLKMAKHAGVNAVFYPAKEEMYREGYSTFIEADKKLASVLCGASRPGHFKGVATVVVKLFNIISPHYAYFGQKDAQQCVVIKKITEDLNIPVKIKVMPTVREKDGLAMSSRNTYLSAEERSSALVLYQSLKMAEKMIKSRERNSGRIKSSMKKLILSKPFTKIDYISIVNPDTLQEIKKIEKNTLIALAVKVGKTRLIDNLKIL